MKKIDKMSEKKLFTEDDIRIVILKSFLLGMDREESSKEVEDKIIEQIKKDN